MFIYEKDGKLNISFLPGQLPSETPDYIIEKDKFTVGESTFPTPTQEAPPIGGKE